MKITAKVVPYSSVVGSSITLHAESGMTICQLSLLSVIPPNFKFTPELHKQTSICIAEWVASALNGAAEFDAASALEDSKAGLANATNDPTDPDLSSLRKGADVVGEAAAYDFVAGWHERQAKLFREMAEDDPRTAKPARDRAKEAAVHHAASAAALRNRAADDRRAALVSGSREEQS